MNAKITGNMPSSAAGYQYAPLRKIYPANLLALFQKSLVLAAPAVGDAVLERHLQRDPEHVALADQRERRDTPQKSATFIEQVLQGKALL